MNHIGQMAWISDFCRKDFAICL